MPCVGLDGSAAAEIFENGVTGVLVDREDKQGMARQLSGLLLDSVKRQQLADSAFERYQELFQASHFAARLEAILDPVLKSNEAVQENR